MACNKLTYFNGSATKVAIKDFLIKLLAKHSRFCKKVLDINKLKIK